MLNFIKSRRIHFTALVLLSGVLIFLIALSVVPQWREQFRATFSTPKREVVAAVSADLARTGEVLRIIKVIEGPAIYIEVYDELSTTGPRRLDRKQLAGTKNAYFTFRGESTSLALYDLDQDGQLEIITPSIESGLVTRMNVFKYQPQSKHLVELKGVAIP